MLIEEHAAPRPALARADSHASDPAMRTHTRSLRRASDAIALVVTDGEPLGRRMPIGPAPVIIGRGAGVDMQIVDPTVSRHHCVIWRAAGRCWIRDLGSTNHTRINNKAARIAELFEGDVVVVGQTALTLAAVADGAVPLGASELKAPDTGIA